MSLINKRNNKIEARTCRICLDAKSFDMVLIEEQNGWLKLFEFCFGFTLTTQDKPRLLCQTCAEKVQSYVKFKEKCHKSHNLWKLVISDVTCDIIKYEEVENQSTTKENYDEVENQSTTKENYKEVVNLSTTKENANSCVTSTTYIKNETFDSLFEDEGDTQCSNYDEMETFSPAEFKIEIDEEIMSKNEDCNTEKNDCIARNKVTSKQTESKIVSVNKESLQSLEKKVYTCVKCKYSYGKKKWYLKHIAVCQGKRKKVICSQEYSYNLGRKYDDQNMKVKQEPQNKIEIIGNQSNSLYSCGLCNLSFTDAKDVYIHLNDHWSNNDLACKLCDFVGIDLAAIVSHRFSHLPRKKMHFVCHICEIRRYSLLALHFHYRSEHLKKAGGYCSRCNKKYDTLPQWKKHEKTHRNPEYKCDICGKEFTIKSSIVAHMIDHMRLDKSICDICGKVVTRERYLKAHKESVHNQSGPIKCTHCNRMFKSQISLKRHQQFVARERTLECEVCHKTFINHAFLKEHMIAHADVRPFSCDLCGKNYKRKAQLTEHLQKHNGIVPQCSICMKTFSNARSLRRHAAVHTGVRRYSCKVANCKRSFHMKKQMLAHIQLRHKNEILEKNEVLQQEIV